MEPKETLNHIISLILNSTRSIDCGDSVISMRIIALGHIVDLVNSRQILTASPYIKYMLCIFPDNSDTLMLNGSFKKNVGSVYEGLSWLLRASVICPKSQNIQRLIYSGLEALTYQSPELFNHNNWLAFKRKLLSASSSINFLPIYIKYGIAAWAHGERTEAIQFLNLYKVLKDIPAYRCDVFNALHMIAEYQIETMDYKGAEETLDKIPTIDISYSHEKLFSLRASLYGKTGDVNKATYYNNIYSQFLRDHRIVSDDKISESETDSLQDSLARIRDTPEHIIHTRISHNKISMYFNGIPSFFPLHQEHFSDLDYLIKNYILDGLRIHEKKMSIKDNIFTFGSCFATNIAQSLRMHGINVYYTPLGEDVNTTFANLSFLRWVSGDKSDSNYEAMDSIYRGQNNFVRQWIEESNYIIITAGVAPATFVSGTNEYVFISKNRLDFEERYQGKIELRTTTVEQNKTNIREMISIIRGINNKCAIYISISPVALNGTYEFKSAFIADCTSKSVLRAAVHEIIDEIENLYYWPSFEIVRWLGSHMPMQFFGGSEDHRHVDRWLIDKIMAFFIEMCCEKA